MITIPRWWPSHATAMTVGVIMALTMPVHVARAQTVLSDYRITTWTEQDGLPPGAIWSLGQDPSGFLWLGADAGLLRFDGARFVTWESLGGQALQPGPVQVLCVATDGSLWIAHRDGGVSRIQRDQVRFFDADDGLSDGIVASIVQDGDGVMWVSGSGGVHRFDGVRWRRAGDGLPDRPVIAMSVSASGDMSVIVDGTVYGRRARAAVFQQIGASDDATTRAVAQDTAGRVWVTDRFTGVRRIDDSRPMPGVQNGKGYRLLAGRRGDLWVATFGQGVWRLRADARGAFRAERATDLNGLSNNVIYALLEDREGNIWVGTTDGLNRLTPQKMTHLLTPDLVTGLEPAPDATIWAGTADALVRITQTGEEVQRLPGVRPRAMHVDAQGTLWVATDESVVRMTAGARAPEVVISGLRHVRSMTSDFEGRLWLFDSDRGLVRWQGRRLDPVSLPHGFEDSRVTLMFTSSDGTVWMSGDRKIASVNRSGDARVYGTADGLDIGSARAFYSDKSGVLWIAGSTGLSRLSDGRFVTLRRSGGLPAESLTGIVQDDEGMIWVGAGSGIVRIDRAAFDHVAAGGVDESHFAVYDSADGVAGTVGWNGQRSALRTGDGRLWFLTASGVTVVDPETLGEDRVPVPVRIEQVAFDDRRAAAAGLEALPAGVARLQIEYTVPNLTTPRRTRFRYRLEGFDPEWIDAGRQRQAIYTNLPPRSYRFIVQARNDDGDWSSAQSAWAFTVQPAFYQTTWFVALSAITLVAVGWTAWRVRVRQVHKQYALLLRERARLSREIHDTLLQSLAGVALQCDALANDPNPTPKNWRLGLTLLRKQVEEYIRECRQTIWDLRSPTLEHYDLPMALRMAAERTTSAAGVALDVEVIGTTQRCPSRIEQQLLRIGQEAIINAARHAAAQRVRVELRYSAGAVGLRVSDDGRGFDPADPMHQVRGHWGLVSMKERAEAVGGRVTITSRADEGTAVDVVVPLPAHGSAPDDASHPDPLHRRSSDRAGGDRADHQPAA